MSTHKKICASLTTWFNVAFLLLLQQDMRGNDFQVETSLHFYVPIYLSQARVGETSVNDVDMLMLLQVIDPIALETSL